MDYFKRAAQASSNAARRVSNKARGITPEQRAAANLNKLQREWMSITSGPQKNALQIKVNAARAKLVNVQKVAANAAAAAAANASLSPLNKINIKIREAETEAAIKKAQHPDASNAWGTSILSASDRKSIYNDELRSIEKVEKLKKEKAILEKEKVDKEAAAAKKAVDNAKKAANREANNLEKAARQAKANAEKAGAPVKSWREYLPSIPRPSMPKFSMPTFLTRSKSSAVNSKTRNYNCRCTRKNTPVGNNASRAALLAEANIANAEADRLEAEAAKLQAEAAELAAASNVSAPSNKMRKGNTMPKELQKPNRFVQKLNVISENGEEVEGGKRKRTTARRNKRKRGTRRN
jgi:hypothetical protein